MMLPEQKGISCMSVQYVQYVTSGLGSSRIHVTGLRDKDTKYVQLYSV